MTDRPQKADASKPEDEDGPPADGLGELPPIDGGDPDVAVPAEELGSEAEEADDDGAFEEPADGFSEEQLRAFSEDLGDFEEAGAPDPDDERELPSCDLDLFDEDDGWSDGADDPSALDEDWFDDRREDDREVADDGGADGPVDDGGGDALEPLDALPGDDDAATRGAAEHEGEEEDPDLLEAAAAIAAEADGAEDAWGGDLDVRYLGPTRGAITGAALVGGAPLAVGDGLYRLGADGLLHRYDEEGEELGALSIAAAGDTVFLGTEERGALRATGFAPRLVPVGIPGAGQPPAEDAGALAPCRVFAQESGRGVRLVALTGGRLYASDDLGRLWRGPLLADRCLAVLLAEGGEGSLIALVERGGAAELLESADLDTWSRIVLPEPVAGLALDARLSMAAGGGILAIALDCPTSPLFVSIDGGASFSEIGAIRDVTALAIDPREPGWIAAATYRAEEDVGVVRTTRDAGATWRTAFVTGLAEEREEPGEWHGRVVSLAVAGDDARLLVAVAGDGVYAAALPERDASH